MRHWIWGLSLISIISLVGNLVMLNFVMIHSPARNILPAQYKVNKPLELNGHTVSRQQRSIRNADLSLGVKKFLDSKTTAHPIPLKGHFLDNQTTQPPPTRKTRRPPKPKSPASILTNPNVPVETTTHVQTTTTKQAPAQDISTTTTEINQTMDVVGKAMRNVEDLHLDETMESNKSRLLDRDWSQFTIDALVFTTPGLGMLVGYLPISWLVHRKGSRFVIGISLLFSSVFVVLQMKIVSFGAIYVCVLRFLHGLTCSSIFAFIGTNAAQWATLKEQLTFLTLSFSAILFAPVVTWTLVDLIIDTSIDFEIQVIHYIVGVKTLMLAVCWLLFYRDFPYQHRWVSGIELNKIAAGKTQNNRVADRNIVPVLLKSVSTWSLIIASFAYFSAFALIVNFLPIYLAKVLKLGVDSRVSLTFIFAVLSHTACIALNKYNCGFSSTMKIRVINTVAFLLTGILFGVLAAYPPHQEFANTSYIIILFILLPLGLSTMGFIHGSVIYGRFFTQHIVSSMQLPFALSMTLMPMFVVFMTIENELRYWRLVFLVVSAFLVVGSVIFALLMRGEPASWAEHTWDPSTSYKMRDLEYISRNEECGLLEMRRLDNARNEINVE